MFDRSSISVNRTSIFAVLLLVLGCTASVQAQNQRFTLAVRGIPLSDALEQFVNATGLAVAYDPTITRGQVAYCAAANEEAEDILRCILAESKLDFYRLSSGTYVITKPVELKPRAGFLAGLVKDGDTGTPLENAHVYLVDAGLGSVTNRAGQFVFPPLLPGTYAIRVSHLGYHVWQDTLLVRAQRRTNTEAVLKPEPILITPVVVDGFEQRVLSEHLGREWVGDEHWRSHSPFYNGVAYPELAVLPGVRMHDVTADVHIQGGETGEHELRLDNVPVYLPRSTLGLLGPFSAFSLERITVHKSGFDVTHGSQLSGVIMADHALEATDRADVQLDPLSLNARVQLSPRISGTSEVAVMAAARIGIWDMYQPGQVQQMLRQWHAIEPDLDYSDFHTAARFQFGPLRSLYVSAYRGANRFRGDQKIGVTTGTQTFATIESDKYEWNNLLGQIRYDAVLGRRTLVNLQLRASSYQMEHVYGTLEALTSEPDFFTSPATFFPKDIYDANEVKTIALEGGVDYASPHHHLESGLEIVRTESAFDLNSVHLYSEYLSGSDVPESGSFVDRTFFPSDEGYSVTHAPASWRMAAYAGDHITLGRGWYAEPGVRLTYIPERATVYAEPRLAIVTDRNRSLLGPWSARLSAGLYRQYTAQIDVSAVNPMTLLPSVRVWLPLDASVRPPLAYHLTHEMIFRPSPRWDIGMEGYYRYQPHVLAIRYVPIGDDPYRGLVRDQAQFMVHATGYAYGGTLSTKWNSTRLRLNGLYEYGHATRTSPYLFEGRTVTVPWNQPHRVELGIDWLPLEHFVMSIRGHGVWGRAWGFRQAFYDYYGHKPETRYRGTWDLGNPSEHVLPPLLRLDVGIAYSKMLGSTTMQARLDVLNVSGRKNVADWSLTFNEGRLVRQIRYFYPRIPSLALRLAF